MRVSVGSSTTSERLICLYIGCGNGGSMRDFIEPINPNRYHAR